MTAIFKENVDKPYEKYSVSELQLEPDSERPESIAYQYEVNEECFRCWKETASFLIRGKYPKQR